MAWVSTEAVRTQSRELVLGKSLSEFMRKLDLHTSGGSSRGDRTRLRNQMRRLLGELVIAYSVHDQLVGTVAPDILRPVAGVGAGDRAECQ